MLLNADVLLSRWSILISISCCSSYTPHSDVRYCVPRTLCKKEKISWEHFSVFFFHSFKILFSLVQLFFWNVLFGSLDRGSTVFIQKGICSCSSVSHLLHSNGIHAVDCEQWKGEKGAENALKKSRSRDISNLKMSAILFVETRETGDMRTSRKRFQK